MADPTPALEYLTVDGNSALFAAPRRDTAEVVIGKFGIGAARDFTQINLWPAQARALARSLVAAADALKPATAGADPPAPADAGPVAPGHLPPAEMRIHSRVVQAIYAAAVSGVGPEARAVKVDITPDGLPWTTKGGRVRVAVDVTWEWAPKPAATQHSLPGDPPPLPEAPACPDGAERAFRDEGRHTFVVGGGRPDVQTVRLSERQIVELYHQLNGHLYVKPAAR